VLRRSPRTALAWAAAVVVAAVTAAVVLSSLASLRHQDQAFGALHPVVVARRDLAVGTRITRADLGTRRIRGEAPDADALPLARAVGRVVRVPLLRGAIVTDRHVTDAHREGLGGVVPAGRRAVRVVVEHGARPTVGDVVDVLATFDPATIGDDRDPTVVVAPGVTVIAVDTPADASDTVGVTVLVTPAESTRLAFSAAAGTIALALAPPEAAAR
jgi:Flp pilus assembly protein CpaB